MEIFDCHGWKSLLAPFPTGAEAEELCRKVREAYVGSAPVYPPRELVFEALRTVPPEKVKCVILGQDPYHEPGQAHGLSFSVPRGTPLPPSLKNIYKELESDLGRPAPEDGDLHGWAEQGVLLLNSVLTVEQGKAGSHRGFGWERVTDGIIAAAGQLPQPVAFVLWGKDAQKKASLIENRPDKLVLCSAHPSPLSAYRGFFGSRPFSRVNAFLREQGAEEIDWCGAGR